MGLRRTWEDERKTVLRFEGDGDWTWIDYDNFIDETLAEIAQLNHTVHIIFMPPQRLPPGSPIPHLQRVARLLPENVGKLIMIGGNMFIRSINTALTKVHPKMSKHMVFVATMDEAGKLLKALDPTQA